MGSHVLWLLHMGMSCCSGVITSPVRCSTRAEWLASHQLPDTGRMFTLVAGLRPVKDPLYLVQTFSRKILSHSFTRFDRYCLFAIHVAFSRDI